MKAKGLQHFEAVLISLGGGLMQKPTMIPTSSGEDTSHAAQIVWNRLTRATDADQPHENGEMNAK
jgi:hypothetical protein